MEDLRARKRLARLMLRKAEEDLRSAAELEGKVNSDSVYHSQQACEKAVKAVLALEGEVVDEHLVASRFVNRVLIHQNHGWEDRLRRVAQHALSLEEQWLKPRYPFVSRVYEWDPTTEYRAEDAREALGKAQEVLAIVTEFIRARYGPLE